MPARSSLVLVLVLVLVACAGGAACSTGGPRHADANETRDSGPMTPHPGADGSLPGADANDTAPVISADARALLERLRYDSAPPPADPSNRVADEPAARVFGQRLFFETGLSGRLLESDNDGNSATLGRAGEAGRVSCAGCHVPTAGFVDVRSPHQQISLAAQWTRRRTPTLLEVAFAPLYNWDGGRDTIWRQAIGVFESSSEFNSGRLFIARQVFDHHRTEYEAVFGPMPGLDDAGRFPALGALEAGCSEGPKETARCRGLPGDGADYDGMSTDAQDAVTTVTVNVAKALAAYVRQLRCGPGRFEQWLDGDDAALGASELRGAALFVGSARCASCHSGPNLTDGKFHNVGLRPATVAVAFTDTGDRGAAEGLAALADDPLNARGAFSDGDRGVLPPAVTPDMEGAFRTPTLRCVTRNPSFMHTGQHRSLEQVVRFFNAGGDPAGFPGTKEIEPLGLSERDRADLVAFLGTLDGPGPDLALLSPPGD